MNNLLAKEKIARAMFDGAYIEHAKIQWRYKPELIPGYTTHEALDTAWASDGKTRNYWITRASEAMSIDLDVALTRELVEALKRSSHFTIGYSEKTFDQHGLMEHCKKVNNLITRAEATLP